MGRGDQRARALEDGLLQDLGLCITCPEDMADAAAEKLETVS